MTIGGGRSSRARTSPPQPSEGGDVAELDEDEMLERFRVRRQVRDPVVDQIERDVIGGDFGADGYTTRSQADELGRRTDLGPGRRLLDVGTGCGWPGLYLAATTGCSVVGTDIPMVGLARGSRRAREEGIDDRAGLVACRAEALAFRAGSFDALVHTDVLC